MKVFKSIQLIALIAIYSFAEIHAQEVSQEYQAKNVLDYTEKTPEIAQMDQYLSVPIDLATGKLNYTIPLYTLKNQDISIPIAASYSSGGVNVESTPGILGEGWNLTANYYISRAVVGLPDDDPNTGLWDIWDTYNLPNINSPSVPNSEFLSGLLTFAQRHDIVEVLKADVGLDVFSYSIPGHSGKFYVDPANQEIIQVPLDALKIEMYTHINGLIDYWTITDTQGKVYTFDKQEYSKQSITNSSVISDSYKGYAATWKIGSIQSISTNAKVSFYYKTNFSYENTKHFKEYWEKVENGEYPKTFSEQTSSYSYGQNLYLSHIRSNNTRVFFEFDSRQDYAKLDLGENIRSTFYYDRLSSWLIQHENEFLAELENISIDREKGIQFIDWFYENEVLLDTYIHNARNCEYDYTDDCEIDGRKFKIFDTCPLEIIDNCLPAFTYVHLDFCQMVCNKDYIDAFQSLIDGPTEFRTRIINSLNDFTSAEVISILNSLDQFITSYEDDNQCYDGEEHIECYLEDQNIQGLRLKRIKVSSDFLDNYLTFKFNHNYFWSSTDANKIGSQQTYQLRRLRLDEIDIYGGIDEQELQKYVFEYYYPNNLMPRNSTSQDFWGFNNGQSNLSQLCPSFFDSEVSYNGANRYPDNSNDAIYAKAGMLKSVTFPTGGKAEFEYEQNDYSYIGDIEVEDAIDHLNMVSVGGGDNPRLNRIIEARINADPLPSTGKTDYSSEFEVCEEITGSITYNLGTLEDEGYACLQEYNTSTQNWECVRSYRCGGLITTNCGSGSDNVLLQINKQYRFMIQNRSLTFPMDDYILDENLHIGVVIPDIDCSDPENPPIIETLTAGGVRIKKVTMNPDDGGPTIVKTYSYGEIDNYGLSTGKSTGVLATDIPKYWYVKSVPETPYAGSYTDIEVKYLVVGSKSFADFGVSNGSHIGYHTVYEKITNSENELLGSTKYNFTSAIQYPMEFLIAYPINLVKTDDEWKRGILTKETTYAGMDYQNPVKTVSYTNQITNEGQNIPLLDLKWEYRYNKDTEDNTRSRFAEMRCIQNTGKHQITNVSTVIDNVESNESTSYNSTNLLPNQISKEISENKSKETLIYYPVDYAAFADAGIDLLNASDMIGVPVLSLEIIRIVELDPVTGLLTLSRNIISAVYYKYSTSRPGFIEEVRMFRPENPVKLIGRLSNDFMLGKLSEGFEDVSTRSSSNEFNRINQITNEDGIPISIIWDHGYNYPTIICKGLNYTDLKNQLTSNGVGKSTIDGDRTFELSDEEEIETIEGLFSKKLITIIKWDTARGIILSKYSTGSNTANYDYDYLNRLLEIVDHRGNLVCKYSYNYANQ